MQQDMCLFFVSINHLFVILNSTINEIRSKDRFVVISDYDSEQLMLRWSNIVPFGDLKNLKKVEFRNDMKCDFSKDDVVIRVEPEFKHNPVKCGIKIDCYDMFLHKKDIQEITNQYEYLVNSLGIIPLEEHGEIEIC